MDAWLKALNHVFSGSHLEIPKEAWAKYFVDKAKGLPTREQLVFDRALAWVAERFREFVEYDEEYGSFVVKMEGAYGSVKEEDSVKSESFSY